MSIAWFRPFTGLAVFTAILAAADPAQTAPAATTQTTADVDWVLTLDKTMAGKGTEVYLARRGGAWSHSFALLPKYNKGNHVLDIAGLKLSDDGSRLAGTMKVTVGPDGYLPEDNKPVPCEYTVDVTVKQGGIAGTWTGMVDGVDGKGTISGLVKAAATDAPKGRLVLYMMNAVHGFKEHQDHKEGILTIDVKAKSAKFSDKDPWHWTSSAKVIEGTIDRDRMHVIYEANVTSGPSHVTTGKYRYVLDATFIAGHTVGTATVTLDGKDLPLAHFGWR